MKYSVIKNPLFRKVNTKARGVHHGFGGDFHHGRNIRKETREQVLGAMHGRKRRGLDYTPLFKFLLSRVGSNWDVVFSEAVSRIDRPEPIFWLVALSGQQKNEMVQYGASSFFSGLYVDTENTLQVVNPDIHAEELTPYCTCCTHTFNGKVFGKKLPNKA